VLLGAGGGVDHHALPGPRRADEHRGTLGTREDSQRVILLCTQWSPDALGDHTHCVCASVFADVPARWLGEQLSTALDGLLLSAYGERGHPPALQSEHPPVTDHLASDRERLLRWHLPGCLLQRHRMQIARLEDGVLLGQPRLNAILDGALDPWPFGRSNQTHGLVGPEPVATARLAPHPLQVPAGRQLLGAAVLEREVTKLPTLRCPAVASTETLCSSGDLPAASGELLGQATRHPGDLEVPAVLTRPALNLIALLCQLLGER
jgi:hypothetical protein